MSQGEGHAVDATWSHQEQIKVERLQFEQKITDLHASLCFQVSELGRMFDAKLDAVEKSTAKRIEANAQALAGSMNTLGAFLERYSDSGRYAGDNAAGGILPNGPGSPASPASLAANGADVADDVRQYDCEGLHAPGETVKAALGTHDCHVIKAEAVPRDLRPGSGDEFYSGTIARERQQACVPRKRIQQASWHSAPPAEHAGASAGSVCFATPVPKGSLEKDGEAAMFPTMNDTTHFDDCSEFSDDEIKDSGEDALKTQKTQVLAEVQKEVVEKEVWIDKPVFKTLIYASIIGNAIQMGICVRPNSAPTEDHTSVCMLTDHGFTVIFIIEAVLKLSLLRHKYFHSSWNILDFSISLLGAVDLWLLGFFIDGDGGQVKFVRVFRLLRVVRLLRMLKLNKNISVLVEGLIGSIQAMGWVGVLMFLFMYAYAIMCVMIFGDKDYQAWRYPYFQNMADSMFTLFNMGITAEWSEVIRPIMDDQWFLCLYFVFFLFMASFGLLNLIIGVITERANNATIEWHDRERAAYVNRTLEKIRLVADTVFAKDQDGTLTVTELDQMMSEYQDFMENLTANVSLPYNFHTSDFYLMLTSKAHLTKQCFISGMTRLITSSDFQRDCLLQMSFNQMRKELHQVKKVVFQPATCLPGQRQWPRG